MMPITIARVQYAPDSWQPRHVDDAVQISLVLHGGLRERARAAEEHAGPLSMVVKARGVEHEDRYGPDGALLLALALWGDDGEHVLDDQGRLPEWKWTHGSGPLRPMLRLGSRLSSASTSLPGDDPDVLSVLAAVTPSSRAETRGTPPEWLERVRARLGEERGLRVGLVARDAGVHPVYLTRCFRRWFGCSVATYLQRVRLRHAASLVSRTEPTLGRVAHEAGFSDQAHLNHRFRDAIGITPGRFRALATRSVPSLAARPGPV